MRLQELQLCHQAHATSVPVGDQDIGSQTDRNRSIQTDGYDCHTWLARNYDIVTKRAKLVYQSATETLARRRIATDSRFVWNIA